LDDAGSAKELVRMGRCKNCGVEMGLEETCVFATYKTNVGGREIVVCCPNCASDMEQAAAQPVEAKPVGKAPPKKAPARKAPTKKAPRKVKRGGKKAKKAPRRAKNAARPARRPAKRPAKPSRKRHK